MPVDMQEPVWLSGGEDEIYSGAFFLALVVILAWAVHRRFPCDARGVALRVDATCGGAQFIWPPRDATWSRLTSQPVKLTATRGQAPDRPEWCAKREPI